MDLNQNLKFCKKIAYVGKLKNLEGPWHSGINSVWILFSEIVKIKKNSRKYEVWFEGNGG